MRVENLKWRAQNYAWGKQRTEISQWEENPRYYSPNSAEEDVTDNSR